MFDKSNRRIGYSRSEYVSDLVVHLTGLVAVAAAVPALVFLASPFEGQPGHLTAAMVYGLCFAAMIACSALYNIFPDAKWEWLFKRLDHSAIYLKIAGTYTAFVLIAGSGFALAAAQFCTDLVDVRGVNARGGRAKYRLRPKRSRLPQ